MGQHLRAWGLIAAGPSPEEGGQGDVVEGLAPADRVQAEGH